MSADPAGAAAEVDVTGAPPPRGRTPPTEAVGSDEGTETLVGGLIRGCVTPAGLLDTRL